MNRTYFYAAGLGNGSPLYRVLDIAAAAPFFEDDGFVIPDPGPKDLFVQDLTHVEQAQCLEGCVTTELEAPSFLVA